MRRHLGSAIVLGWVSMVLAVLAGAGARADAAETKFRAVLVWATHDTKPPPGKNYQPVEPEIRKKLLADLPLKWSNFFEVGRTNFGVAPTATRKVAISEKCELQVITLSTGASEIEVLLVGKGKEVVRRKQSLPIGEMLVLGGNAPNDTAWLVILKRIE